MFKDNPLVFLLAVLLAPVGTWLDGNLRLNLTAYHMIWEDIQIQVNDPTIFSLGIVNFAEAEIDPELIPTLANEATQQWTGTFNPKPLTLDDFQELYACAVSETSP